MDARLVQLLGSFIGARSRYVLARLEFALRHPRLPAPPLIERLDEPSERALREEWPLLEEQLGVALAYADLLQRTKRRTLRNDGAYRALERALRELDQHARALRWVMTVTERGTP